MSKDYLKYKEEGTCIRCGSDRANGKSRCERCHKLHLEYQQKAKAKYKANGLCHSCGKEPRIENQVACIRCSELNKEREYQKYKALRLEVIVAYGEACRCCGLSVHKYLQLDHIENDGAEHRKEISGEQRGGMYAWAKRNKFPDRLQLLCANCHQAKTTHGGCSLEDHEMMHKAVIPNELRND